MYCFTTKQGLTGTKFCLDYYPTVGGQILSFCKIYLVTNTVAVFEVLIWINLLLEFWYFIIFIYISDTTERHRVKKSQHQCSSSLEWTSSQWPWGVNQAWSFPSATIGPWSAAEVAWDLARIFRSSMQAGKCPERRQKGLY